MYLAWRAVLAGNVRDIVVATSDDYGATWGAPVRVHDDDWVFEGCPHAGPSILVDAAGTLHVGWWTGREGSAGAFYAKSVDGGRTFSPRVPLGEARFSLPSHVQLAMDANKTVVAAWDDGRDTLPKVLLRVSRDGGATFGPELQVGASGAATSFPVVALRNGQLTVAWSERTAEAHAHAEHHMPDMKDPAAVMPLPEVGLSVCWSERGESTREDGGGRKADDGGLFPSAVRHPPSPSAIPYSARNATKGSRASPVEQARDTPPSLPSPAPPPPTRRSTGRAAARRRG
jgi:hypothetical protein